MLGERLKELRQHAGETQEQVANFLGVSRAAYSHFETNRNSPDIPTLSNLAKHYGVSTDYLVNGSNKDGQDKNPVDLDDDNPFLSYQGRPVEQEDIDLFKEIIRRTRGGDKHE